MKTIILGIMVISVTPIFLSSCNQNSGIADEQISDHVKTHIERFGSGKLRSIRLRATSMTAKRRFGIATGEQRDLLKADSTGIH